MGGPFFVSQGAPVSQARGRARFARDSVAKPGGGCYGPFRRARALSALVTSVTTPCPSQSRTGPRLPSPRRAGPPGGRLLSSLSRKGHASRVRHLPLASPFSEALSTLNDRALRRLLGARAYLRGYDYVRRHAVDNIVVEDAGARGPVRGTDVDPYQVTLQLSPRATAGTASTWQLC